MDVEEILDLDIEAVMDQDFYCHLCERDGERQELKTVFYVEEAESYRLGQEKKVAVAEKGCPKPDHVDVEFSIREPFYTEKGSVSD